MCQCRNRPNECVGEGTTAHMESKRKLKEAIASHVHRGPDWEDVLFDNLLKLFTTSTDAVSFDHLGQTCGICCSEESKSLQR